jgi:hypothetical protein
LVDDVVVELVVVSEPEVVVELVVVDDSAPT